MMVTHIQSHIDRSDVRRFISGSASQATIKLRSVSSTSCERGIFHDFFYLCQQLSGIPIKIGSTQIYIFVKFWNKEGNQK